MLFMAFISFAGSGAPATAPMHPALAIAIPASAPSLSRVIPLMATTGCAV